MVVLVRLEEWNKMVVRPHEGTLTKPKGDRLNLLWALKANTSPILALFEDKSQHITSLLTAQERAKPVLSVRNDDGEGHDVRAVTDTEVIGQICDRLANQPLYIADGHHRYESALAYLHEKRAYSSSVSGNEPFNFVMMTLVDFADPGLVILPAHRLVYGMSKSTLDELMPKLEAFFELEELPLSVPGVWHQVGGLLSEEAEGVRFFALIKERLFALKLHDFTATSRMMPYFHSELYKRLDISLVDHVILEELLGLSADREEACLDYSHDMQDAVNKVLTQEYQLAFLLSAVRAEVIKAIADASDRMPRKSTYFYPKTPAGLVFHRLV